MEVWPTPWGRNCGDYLTYGVGEMEAHCYVATGHVVSKKDFGPCLGLGHSFYLQTSSLASQCEAKRTHLLSFEW